MYNVLKDSLRVILFDYLQNDVDPDHFKRAINEIFATYGDDDLVKRAWAEVLTEDVKVI